MEYHANGGGGGLWHATCDRRRSRQLGFEGSWIILLNNNSRELVPITDCSDSNWVVQPSRRCPYCPEFVSVICSGPVVCSYQTNLIWINGRHVQSIVWLCPITCRSNPSRTQTFGSLPTNIATLSSCSWGSLKWNMPFYINSFRRPHDDCGKNND